MKKVIEVGSLNFSGSTMLDLILGNSYGGFSTGEPHAFYRGKHIRCTCHENEDCVVWNNLRGTEFKDMYKNLFEMTGANYIVYSGKTTRNLLEARFNNKFDYSTVFIYKHPASLLKSQESMRGGMFSQAYSAYTEQFLHVFPNSIIVSLKDLAKYPSLTTQKLCAKIGIPYRKNMENFWDRLSEPHLIYGSSSARLHLFDPGTPRFISMARQRNEQKNGDSLEVKHHREFYVSEPQEKYIEILNNSEVGEAWMNTYKKLEQMKI